MANLSHRLAAGVSPLVRIFSSKPKAAAAAAAPQLIQQEADLMKRLASLWCAEGEVKNAIDECIKEGKTVTKIELERCMKEFRRFKRHRHALEISEWMESHNYILKQKDYAIHLDVIAKVKGIAAAENYFNGLPLSSKTYSIYGALLNCYCYERMSDKALDLFGKMVAENMVSTPLPFNHLMIMHIKLGQPEKVVHLGEQMKKANIQPNTSTYNLMMNGYALLDDIEGVERVFREMTMKNEKLCDWTTYSNLANIYIQDGDQEKAKLALQNLEKVMGLRDRDAYHFLISLYAKMSDLENTHRVWKSLKLAIKGWTWNKSYLIMIQALDNLDDLEGLKECFDDWESGCSSYDPRLANTVVVAYLRHDMLEEAESLLERAVVRSEGRFFNSWETLMMFHLKKHSIKQALQTMETAVSRASDGKWKPRRGTVDGFLGCFEQERDVSSAEIFYELMKRINCVDSHLYESLLRIYDVAGQEMCDVRARMERDGVEMSSELEKLVARVHENSPKEASQNPPFGDMVIIQHSYPEFWKIRKFQ